MFDELTTTGTGAIASAQTPTTRRLELFRLPALDICANCTKSLPRDDEFCQQVKVCRKCLQAYSIIDGALNSAAEAKTRAACLVQFAEKAKV